MSNELILILSLLVEFSLVLICFKLFKKQGLYLWTIVATISANIEVLIVVDAFKMEMTLGNILFASTFLVTDILSECYSKKDAQRAVYLGIATSVLFVIISQSWLLYKPNGSDFAFPSIKTIFSNTPRLMLASFLTYAIVQLLDVWLYHKWWAFTDKKFKDHKKFLWLRNNGSTLISQLMNTLLFNFGAFLFVYNISTVFNIAVSSYVIFIVTSVLDTPFIYFARKIKESQTTAEE